MAMALDQDAGRLIEEYARYTDSDPLVLQYRRAHFEARGHVAPGAGMPTARSWPRPDHGLTYDDRLTGLLPTDRLGVEIGALNLPMVSKSTHRVLHVDHTDTEGLKKKYPAVEGIIDVDRVMVNNKFAETLRDDCPIGWVCGSQVLEHVPDLIGWLNDIASVLEVGGLCALSLPDRRFTFDLFRTETRTANIVNAHLEGNTVPAPVNVYDNQLLATAVNVPWLTNQTMTPDMVFAGRGAVSPRKVEADHMRLVRFAQAGVYLDQHVWVFTGPNFLMVMAQLAEDRFLPFKCHQFYPTTTGADGVHDRSLSSFVIVLEKIDERTSLQEARLSFLMALGEPEA